MGKIKGFKEFQRKNYNKRPVSERVHDYKEIYVKLSDDDIQKQAARCMDCGTPFCMWGCPLGNLMPDYNDFVYRGEWEKAYERLRLTNNFPEFTGRLCPALCEASCALGLNYESVSTREMELSIIEKAFKEGYIKPNPPKIRTGKKVAIIGSGPAGLSAASELNSVGHTVTVFEKADKIGGLLRYGIPDFKLDKSVIDRRINILKEEGIIFKTNVNVGKDYETQKLLQDFDAVILAGGSSVPRDLRIEGRELDGIYFAVDYLTAQNKAKGSTSKISAENKSVLVIGGGDTGSDCIGTANRQKASKVYQFEIMPPLPKERTASMPWPTFPRLYKTTTSHEEGCERKFCVSTKKFIGKDGKVDKVVCVNVEWYRDDDGKMKFREIPNTEFELKIDMVILAMGFLHPEHTGIINNLKVELDERGNVKTDGNHMTSIKGVFSAGDMRRGQSLIVWAINDGRQAAKAVDEYLMGETVLRG